jgi:hypothetical protein
VASTTNICRLTNNPTDSTDYNNLIVLTTKQTWVNKPAKKSYKILLSEYAH